MDHITELYCLVDDFCKKFESTLDSHSLEGPGRARRRKTQLSLAEMMTIMILFHQLRYRQFKPFYQYYVRQILRREFPDAPSYQRIIELMPRCALALTAFFQTLRGSCSGISIVDSTPLAVCNNLRIKRHKVFKGLAAQGKSSTGWFFGFKLHAVINHLVKLLAIRLTPGNVDDRKPPPKMARSLWGKLFADKGYISKSLTETLNGYGVELITKVRRNMKAVVRSPLDTALLRKRSLVETVFDELKNLCQIEHSRHRSASNFVVNLLSGVIAYCLMPKKPAIPLNYLKPLALSQELIPS